MEINDIDKSIIVKQAQIQVEQDPIKKQEFNKQLRILQLKKEIETIKLRIAQLS